MEIELKYGQQTEELDIICRTIGAVTLVVFLCYLEVVLSYPRPAAMSERGHDGVGGDREAAAGRLQTVVEQLQETS